MTTNISVAPYLPSAAVPIGEDVQRVEDLVRKINAYLSEYFNRRTQEPVFFALTPSMPNMKLPEEEHLTKYPFGEPLSRIQLGMLKKVYAAGWKVSPMYCSLVKHQLVFVPLKPFEL